MSRYKILSSGHKKTLGHSKRRCISIRHDLGLQEEKKSCQQDSLGLTYKLSPVNFPFMKLLRRILHLEHFRSYRYSNLNSLLRSCMCLKYLVFNFRNCTKLDTPRTPIKKLQLSTGSFFLIMLDLAISSRFNRFQKSYPRKVQIN